MWANVMKRFLQQATDAHWRPRREEGGYSAIRLLLAGEG